jgi:arylsulfatase A-like enzyme
VKRRKYLAQISLMDDAIGTVTAALSETAQRERTLIFFFSDNGGHTPSGSSNSPLRAMKGTLYEGGVRVPFIVSWPAKLPAGATYELPVSSIDVFATALASAGVAMPRDKTYDSVNIVPYLAGEVKTQPHERLLWRMYNKKSYAVREGNWKLVRNGEQPPELFDLAADISESTNVAIENPQVTARLVAALDSWDKELIAPVFPGSSVKNEDWGPGGANQKNAAQPKQGK